MPRVTLVAAVARNGVIGRDNALPWRLPGDLKRFRALTIGHAVIMGRRTYGSLGRPLPGRTNIVLSRNAALSCAGATVVSSLVDALRFVPAGADAFVIGGAEIYRLALPHADRLVLTEIDAAFEGDVRFPEYDRAAFVERAREVCTDEASGLTFDVATYDRGPAASAAS